MLSDPDPDPDLSGSGSGSVPVPLFDHERLDVYRVALMFVRTAHDLASSIITNSSGSGYLVDQLRRAASSIVLNIAEGAGEYRPVDKMSNRTGRRKSGWGPGSGSGSG